MKSLLTIKNPEATYGAVLIFAGCFLAFLLFCFPGLFGNTYSNIKCIIEVILFLITGILLKFKRRNYLFGGVVMICCLALVAASFIEIFISEISEAIVNIESIVILIFYFLLFFVMNLMIMIRIVRGKSFGSPLKPVV